MLAIHLYTNLLFFSISFFILIDWCDVLGFLICLLSYVSICSRPHIAFNNFPGFWKRYILCVLYMHYFLFPLVKLTGPWKGRVLFMTICTLYIFAFTLCVVWITFTTLPTHLTSSANVFLMSKFLTPEAPQGSWYKLLYPFNHDFFQHFRFIKRVCILSLFLRMVILVYSLTPCFWSIISISSGVANESSRLIMPLEVFNIAYGYALHLMLWNLSIFSMFSACFFIWTSTSRLPFLSFLTFFGLHQLNMIFFYEERW